MNYKLIASKLGDGLKYDTSANQIGRAASSIFPFSKRAFPQEHITSTRSQTIYDWVMTLAEESLPDEVKRRLLSEFVSELAPDNEALKTFVSSQIQMSETMPSRSKTIFISHANKDKFLADELVDLLEKGIGINAQTIFCSSLPGLGIPPTAQFVDNIKNNEINAEVVLLLLSPNYFESNFCLCEMGAAWATSTPTIPLIISPLEFHDVKDVILGHQALKVSASESLDELQTELVKILGINAHPVARWNVKKDAFLLKLPTIIEKLPAPDKVPQKRYLELEEKYNHLVDLLNESDKEKLKLRNTIEELKRCKDSAQVKEVISNSIPEMERFELFCKEFRNSARKVSNPVIRALFYDYRHEPYRPEYEEWDAAKDAQEEGYLEHQEDEKSFGLAEDPTVKALKSIINKIDKLISTSTEEFSTAFSDKFGYSADLSNKRLWKEHLSL